MKKHAYVAVFGNTYPFRKHLKQAGLRWEGQQWRGTLPVRKVAAIKNFCRKHNLQYIAEQDGIQERRLARNSPPAPVLKKAALMGEGRLQWQIEEMLYIERKRNQWRKTKSGH